VSAPAAGIEVERVAERALLVRFHDRDLGRAVRRANALHRHLEEQGGDRPSEEASRGAGRSWHAEWVPGAGNLLLRLDDTATARDLEAVRARLDAVLANFAFDDAPTADRVLETPVRFGGAEGEDLAAVARETGLSENEVVARLCAAQLTVAFLGFAPGFPYLIGLPPELEVPRLSAPRPRVPAGSVAIAGPFAGIYPSSTPGGWRLLGRTDLSLFDPSCEPPARLAPGDRVRLVAI